MDGEKTGLRPPQVRAATEQLCLGGARPGHTAFIAKHWHPRKLVSIMFSPSLFPRSWERLPMHVYPVQCYWSMLRPSGLGFPFIEKDVHVQTNSLQKLLKLTNQRFPMRSTMLLVGTPAFWSGVPFLSSGPHPLALVRCGAAWCPNVF